MSHNLKTTTRNALLWNILDKVATQVVSIAVSYTLALLLDVADFGLMGMLALFIAVSNTLTDSGFSAALIRKDDAGNRDYNTAFYFNLLISFALYLILFFGAPLIAGFYDKPLLVPLARVIFLALIINALGLIQSAQMTKRIQFKQLTNINVAALFLSGVAAIVSAFLGCGVWALAVQLLTQSTVRTIALWFWGNWWPGWQFSRQSFRELFSFGYNLTIAGVLNAIFLNIYSFFIGKLFSDRVLGYYTQAGKWSDMGIASIYGSVQNATYPIFSTIQHEKERLIRAYRKTVRLTAFVTLPALLGIALISRPLTMLLFPDGKWEPSIVYMQLLSVAGIFTVFTAINTNFIKIAGNTRTLLRLEYVKMGVVILVFLCTYRYSLEIIVAGQVLVRMIVLLLNMVVIGRTVGYGWLVQIRDIAPYAVISICMLLLGCLLRLVTEQPLFLVGLQVLFCTLFYYGVNRWLHSRILEDIMQTFKLKRRDEEAH